MKTKTLEAIPCVLSKKTSDVGTIAVVLAQYWFEELKVPPFIQPDSLVVCRWSDFHDGENSHIEGKETIAVCRDINDAISVYKNYN
jgi:hypothetical protein